jgi:CDP-diacylglycerol--glycerol-3-phosphate 3-phosphatidyltransferase
VLVIPITLLLWYDGPLLWLFALVMMAILTDWFDGRLARWLDTESEWGKVLDPIADKIGAVATISALTFRTAEPSLPAWFFIALMTRDLLILAGSLLIVRRSGKVAASVWAGKAATFWLAVTVLAAVLKADPPVMQFCVWMTTALLALSFVVYLIRYLNAARRTPPPQPMPADKVEERVDESLAQLSAEDLDETSGAFVPPPSEALTETPSAAGDGTHGQSPQSPSETSSGNEPAPDSKEARSQSSSADSGKASPS